MVIDSVLVGAIEEPRYIGIPEITHILGPGRQSYRMLKRSSLARTDIHHLFFHVITRYNKPYP